MSFQLSDAVRNAMMNQYETVIGTAPRLELRTGTMPANTGVADTGVLIATINLPTDWLSAAAGGTVSILGGPWSATATAGGVIGHFRLKNTAGTVTHEQGSVTLTGGGGALTVDNTNVTSGQTVQVTGWSRTAGGA